MVTFKEFLKTSSLNPQKAMDLINSSFTPVFLAYESSNGPVSIPVWAYFYEDHFYIFSGKNSKKVQAIEQGKTRVSLTLLNREGYPMPIPSDLNYFGLRGNAKIVKTEDVKELVDIHLDLLLKYDPHSEEQWIRELVEKIKTTPEAVWMIQIDPTNYFRG